MIVNDAGSDCVLEKLLLIQRSLCKNGLPYFLGYKTEYFSFLSNLKNLDPSHKTDLDLWDCLGRVNFVL